MKRNVRLKVEELPVCNGTYFDINYRKFAGFSSYLKQKGIEVITRKNGNGVMVYRIK